MEKRERTHLQKEIRLEAHLCMVVVFSLLSLALFVETLLLGWGERWTLPIITAAIAVMWSVHITQAFTEKYRVYMYLFLVTVELFFYGSHATSLYDMPILVILVLGVFALSEEETIPFWLVMLYLGVLLYQLPVIKLHLSPLEVSRLGLDIMGVLAAAFLSTFAIRRRKEESRRFNRIADELLATNERTENFLTNVSHELRTPINAVSGITEVLLKNEVSLKKRESLLSVQQAGRRLFSQISDILDYTEIDTERLVVIEEPYLVNSLINDIRSEAQLMQFASRLELIFDVDTHIPATLIGDSAKIKKIMRHLIENGCKFTHEGGVYVRMQAVKKDYGINLYLSVSDTGSGIAESERSQITAFYQSDASRTRKAGGLGLGLPIVQGLTLAMGGFMHIDDAPGGGTCVSVSIPQQVVDETPALSVAAPDALCVACYLKPEKYATGAVRDYYSTMIAHLAASLRISLHRVSTLRDLKNVQQSFALTHLFVGSAEYEEAAAYFESLPREIVVAVVANADFTLPRTTRCKFIAKPFYSLPIVTILNNDSIPFTGIEGLFQKHFACPSVRVLVVDDDEMNLIVAKGILGDYRMQVTTAVSGAAALEICAREDFDVIFMDHMMPEMDGVEAMHQIRALLAKREAKTVIVALTANAVSGAREMFLKEGFDAFLPKPIETSELEHVLKKVLPSTAFVTPPAVGSADSVDTGGVPARAAPIRAPTGTASEGATLCTDDTHTSLGAAHKPADGAHTSALPATLSTAATARVPERGAAASFDDSFFWFESLTGSGVHTDAALSYCANSKDLYREMLEKFIADAVVRRAELTESLEKADLALYAVKVHALKSASKTVGLDELSALSLELETCAKNDDRDTVRKKHEALMRLLSEAVLLLCDALNGTPPDVAHSPDEAASLGEVPSAEPAAVQMPEPAAVQAPNMREALLEIQSLIENFETSEAAAALQKLLTALDGGRA